MFLCCESYIYLVNGQRSPYAGSVRLRSFQTTPTQPPSTSTTASNTNIQSTTVASITMSSTLPPMTPTSTSLTPTSFFAPTQTLPQSTLINTIQDSPSTQNILGARSLSFSTASNSDSRMFPNRIQQLNTPPQFYHDYSHDFIDYDLKDRFYSYNRKFPRHQGLYL